MKRAPLSISQQFAVLSIRIYQHIRPFIDQLNQVVFGFSSACKHQPTCSEFAIECVRKYGTMRGIFLGTKRILSCR